MLNKLKQWQTTWWIVLLEGILLLGIGSITWANPQVVGPWIAPWIVVLIGIYLLVDSSAIIRDNTKGQAHSASRSYQLAAAGIGLITVLYLLLRLLFGAESSLITRTIFSLGLALSGLVFLIGIVATDDKQAVRTRDIVASLLKILVAAVFLITPPGVMLRLIAFVALYIGVVQVVNAVILLRRGTKDKH